MSHLSISTPTIIKKIKNSLFAKLLVIFLLVGTGLTALRFFVLIPAREARTQLPTQNVERQDLKITITANGKIEPERSINISPKNAGVIKNLLVKEGDIVKKGQTLAYMDDSNLQGQLTQAKAGISSQEASLEKLKAGNRSEEIAQAKAQLEEMESLNRLKDEFLSTVSHELRTPLTNMKMAIQMLNIGLKKEQPSFDQTFDSVSGFQKTSQKTSKVSRYFEILNNECDREISLINNFLDLQRLDTSSKSLILETIEVNTWLERVVELFNARNRNCCKQKLNLAIESNLPAIVCDPFSLERILDELLTNACKFSPANEEIIISAKLKSSSIQFQVMNTGVEIDKAELPRIFDKFYRIPSNDPWKQGGTGLGLALVQKLTKHLGGVIEVKSGSGCTCFSVKLPLEKD